MNQAKRKERDGIPTTIQALSIVTVLLIATVLTTTVVLTDASRQDLTNATLDDARYFVDTFALTIASGGPLSSQKEILAQRISPLVTDQIAGVWVVQDDLTPVAQTMIPGMTGGPANSARDAADIQAVIRSGHTTAYTDGPYLRVIAPIVGSSGQIEGAVLVYASTQRVQDALRHQFEVAALTAALIMGAAFVGVLLLGRWALGMVNQITRAAQAIEAGTFDPASLAKISQRHNEIGLLARVLTSMAREVRAREEHLVQQVQELRIEINQARKAREVAEIVDSDYFHELQKKANDIRARHPSEGAPAPPAERQG